MHIVFDLLASLLPETAGAQIITNDVPGCDFVTGYLSAACIPIFIGHVIQVIMGLVGGLFIINVMIGGWQYAIGAVQGDEGKGKERIQWSIIGLIVTTCAFLIFDLVWEVLGA